MYKINGLASIGGVENVHCNIHVLNSIRGVCYPGGFRHHTGQEVMIMSIWCKDDGIKLTRPNCFTSIVQHKSLGRPGNEATYTCSSMR